MKMICQQCGTETEARPSNIKNGRAKYCSKSCSSRSKKGERSARWKGGTFIRYGYRFVKCEGHPRADKDGYIHEAILIAEKKIGRFLGYGEITHHINGIKDDNRPENIEVMSNSNHVRNHGIIVEINKEKNRHGRDNPFYGKHHTEEAKREMSNAKRGKLLSEKHKHNLSVARKRYLRNVSCV